MRNSICTIILLFICFDVSPQNVGIGTPTPAEKLDLLGNIKITGEIKPNGVAGLAGQVLTANGNGTIQWATATTGTGGNDGGWGDCSIFNIDSYQLFADPTGQSGDSLGWAVSISGDHAIVGAYHDDEGGFTDNGSIIFLKRNAITNVWENQGKLINLAPESGDNFGVSVSISGDYAIVGADLDNEGGFENTGSATIFKRNTATGIWERQIKVFNTSTNSGARFGVSVSISGDHAIVGAPLDNTFGASRGSVSIFKRNSVTGEWLGWEKLMNLGAAANDYFGYSVAISGDYVIVGSYLDDEGGFTNNGSATIFKRNTITGGWEVQEKLTDLVPPDPNHSNSDDNFGWSVGISGDYAIVGAPNDDEFGQDFGSATIFKRNTVSGTWERLYKLKNPRAEVFDQFGYSVSISGDYIIIGTPYDSEVNTAGNGTATIYKKYGNLWLPYQKFLSPYYGINFFYFGRAVSIDGSNNRFVVGAEGILSGKGAAFFGRVK